ncbi:MAG: PD40 domain-containing protein [Acidobacteria bacterium]|nr:PD40 domain-containing protein [Acidobacteriota bacterium]
MKKRGFTAVSSAAEGQRPSRIQFGGFSLDLEHRALYRGETRLHLTAKPLETLIFLLENRGRVVGKQELMDAVWKDTFVTENNLVQAVSEIRRALEDEAEAPRFILTVPRVGYRFIGEVRQEREGPKAGAVADAGRPRRSSLWAGLAVLAVVAVACALIWLPRSQKPTVASTAGAVPRQVSSGVQSAVKPALSPDGRLLLYAASRPQSAGVLDLYIKDAVGESGAWITKQAGASGDLPVFTPDGAAVVFSRYRSGDGAGRLPDLWKVPAAGGTPSLYLESALGAGFSSDGKQVAYTKYLASSRPLWVSPVGELSSHREIADSGYTPRWSPDGKWIAYTTSDPGGGEGDLWVLDAASLGAREKLTDRPQQIYGLAWTPDSRSLIFASSLHGPFQLWIAGAAGGPATPFYSDLDDLTAPHVAPDTNLLVFCKARPVRNLMVWEIPAGGAAGRITEDEYHHWPRLSPSGERVASVLQSRLPEANFTLCITGVQTRERVRFKDRPVHHPCWLDEQSIAYLMNVGAGDTEVRRASLGTGVTVPMARFSGRADWLAADPDHNRVAVVLSEAAGKQRIVVRELESGADRTLAQGGQYEHLRWLPGGRTLFWSGPERSAGAESAGIWMGEPGASAPRRLVPDGYCPVWTADARAVYFSRIGEHSGLWRYDIDKKSAGKIRDWRYVSFHDVAGDRLVYTQDSNVSQIYSMPVGR